jgi:hypothetical protein
MAVSDSAVPVPASSTTLDQEAVYDLLDRVLAAQEAMLAALARLTPPPAASGRPGLRVVR